MQNRREFLTPSSWGKAYAARGEQSGPHYVMVVDLRKCIGCQACTIACEVENAVPPYKRRTIVSTYELSWQGRARRAVLPRLCNHCQEPPCVRGCPTQATYKRDDGLVVVDASVCVACGYCIQNCPYDARFFNAQTKVADKCNFCLQRIENGLLPACVETCVGKARVFGDLNDPDSEVAHLVRSHPVQVLKPNQGTQPQVFYIGLNDALQHTIHGTPAPQAETEPKQGEV